MNLSKLGISSWIIVLNIVLILILIICISVNNRDNFINYPQSINPTTADTATTATATTATTATTAATAATTAATTAANQDVTTANNNYASILIFIQNNPQKSVNFISDIKQKFFNDDCTVKSTIDFSTIAQMPNGMPFK